MARGLEALPDEDLRILLSRRREAAEAARTARPTWAELAATLLHPRNVALTLARLDRFLGQVLGLASLEGGRLTPDVAEAEGLARAHLDPAVHELRRWGLATAGQDGSLVLAPGVAGMIWDPGGLGRPAARLLENL
ncbi:MAG TPA: hypothetical protein VGA16_00805, partial [Candidatus Limnocylindria bacterium]